MPNPINEPILCDYLAQGALRQCAKKKLFGGYYVQGLSIIPISQWLFERGCLLGCAKRDRLEALSMLLFQPGSETQQNVRTVWREEARERLSDYQKEPESFHDFWIGTQYPSIDLLRDAKALAKRKVPLGEVLRLNQFWVSSGIAFGSTYPEIVRRMWTLSYDTPSDPAYLALARQVGWEQKFGWDPEELDRICFDEATQQVLIELAAYVHEYRPELREPLGIMLD